MLSYKGYVGRVGLDAEARTFWGTVVNASVLVSFRGADVDELEKSFHDAIDTFLDDCRRSGRAPQRAYSGKITVRLTPEQHRRAALKAALSGQSMNQFVVSLLEQQTRGLGEPLPAGLGG